MQFSPGTDLLASGIFAAGLNPHIIVTLFDADGGEYNSGIVDWYDADDLSFSHDGEMLAVTNGFVLIYSIADIRHFVDSMLDGIGTDDPSMVLSLPTEDEYVRAAEFSPMDMSIALATSHGRVLLWNLGEPEPMITLPISDCPNEGGSGVSRSIAFSHDGTMIASNPCGDGLELYDGANLTQLQDIQLPQAVTALAFSPDDTLLFIAYEAGALIWDTTAQESVCIVETRGHTPVAVGFTEEGAHLLAITREGAIARWDMESCVAH